MNSKELPPVQESVKTTCPRPMQWRALSPFSALGQLDFSCKDLPVPRWASPGCTEIPGWAAGSFWSHQAGQARSVPGLLLRHFSFGWTPLLGSWLLLNPSVEAAAAAAKSLQSCPTLRDPIDGSPPGSSAHGIYQARVLEWGAIAFSEVQCNPHQNHSCLFFVEIDQLTKIRKEIYP